jgi:methionyl-tRNA formyltransferase
VKAAALELDLPVFEPASLREFADACNGRGYDLFVLASYGRILPQALLDVPKLGSFNVHPSLLPKYRGATPIQTALLDGERETGVSIMLMDAGMDTGDIVLQERTPIDEDERYGELHDRLAAFGAQALSHALDLARSGHIPHRAQIGTPSVTRPIRKDDLIVDWSWSAQRVVNAVRAYAPAPAARAPLGGVPVKLLRARTGMPSIAPLSAGDVVGVCGDAVTVRCGDGTVDVLEVVPPNRGAQSGAAFAMSRR